MTPVALQFIQSTTLTAAACLVWTPTGQLWELRENIHISILLSRDDGTEYSAGRLVLNALVPLCKVISPVDVTSVYVCVACT